MKGRTRITGDATDQESPAGQGTDEALEQALDWLILLEGGDGNCRAAFMQWLEAAPGNAEAYARARRSWQSPLLVEAATRLATPAASRRRRHPPRRSLKVLALAASLLLAAGLLLQSDLPLYLRADHMAAVGQRQSLELSDGSRVLLNTGTALSARLDERQRVTHLHRGEAYFDVARDRDRPFQVKAGPVTVQVRGTAFAVRYLDSGAEVVVERGEVEVSATDPDVRVRLGKGDSVRIGPEGLGVPVQAVVADQLAWVRGRLIFDDRPLSDVLEEVRRYYPGWILNNNPQMDDFRITGNYRLDDPLTIMRSLAQVSSTRLREYPGVLILD